MSVFINSVLRILSHIHTCQIITTVHLKYITFYLWIIPHWSLKIIWKWLILNSTCFKDNLVNHFIQLTFFNDCGGQPTLKIPENLTILRKEYSQLQRITAKPLSWGFHPKWKFFPFCLSSYPRERFLLAPFIFLSHRNHMLLTSLWISCFSRGPSLAWLPAACRGDWDQVIENTDVTAAETAGRTDTS